jgi:hypothetical protein
MRSVLIFFGLLSAFMLVSSLPLGPATLEKRQVLGGTVSNIGAITGEIGRNAAGAVDPVLNVAGAAAPALKV